MSLATLKFQIELLRVLRKIEFNMYFLLQISALSALTHGPTPEEFMFRNYNLPCGSQSQYVGSCQHKLWEAIRASSAAPAYYGEFKLGDSIHQVGTLFVVKYVTPFDCILVSLCRFLER